MYKWARAREGGHPEITVGEATEAAVESVGVEAGVRVLEADLSEAAPDAMTLEGEGGMSDAIDGRVEAEQPRARLTWRG